MHINSEKLVKKVRMLNKGKKVIKKFNKTFEKKKRWKKSEKILKKTEKIKIKIWEMIIEQILINSYNIYIWPIVKFWSKSAEEEKTRFMSWGPGNH